ncbi:MAG: vitamin B12-dependent ribonucleotide reductase [Acidobacteria bacterium]|nr:MAG: vitamin B12-dependent ribonucleotide reductase [Acidobacteriota bacterium]REK04398.1 MAG: vitamin B12-dependent ribonucleotide reductase [Acidobacteriota bacterium]
MIRDTDATHTDQADRELDADAAGRQPSGVDAPGSAATSSAALHWGRHFSTPGRHPFDQVEWSLRDAVIHDPEGNVVFEQRGVEFPTAWSQTAVNIVASKYFYGQLGSDEREHSLRQVIDRVVTTIGAWGAEGGTFAHPADREAFEHELCFLLLHQMAAFNSPVWFNLGVRAQPQCSACFINSVVDSMDSIMGLARTEAMLFKNGSGTGTNLSTLRGSREPLSGGGTSSGPISFMRGYDAFAGVVKSGGRTRRAAKMVILDMDHPDIEEFIRCKELEERKAWALIEAGYDGGFNVDGGAYDSVFFQNANHSVRATDEFMRAVEQDGEWSTRARLDGSVASTHRARDLMDAIAASTWVCGDPGMQFDTTINAWHTCAETAPIHASNPCSEFMFLDDTACNLASLNLMRFRDAEGDFDVASFTRACEIVITAQEILVDHAGYPTPTIAENSHRFRPLGLGYANLGALLMANGLPYDSDEGRAFAGAITALLSGAAYAQSARLAEVHGAFEGFAENREPTTRVMRQHRAALDALRESASFDDDALESSFESIAAAAQRAWDDTVDSSARGAGLRNAQISVLAPTGTIGFMMDCDTTGVEPDIGLVKYKKLVGGGLMKIVNQTVAPALARLAYPPQQVSEILDYIEAHDTIEGAPHLAEEHLPVFDCAFKPASGERSIGYRGHLRMMAAVQPFVSGAISKTINMPEHSTVEEIRDAYVEAWRLGLKAVAIYRDGCKRSQPLSLDRRKNRADSTETETDSATATVVADPSPPTHRRKLPDERQAITHKFSVGGHEGFVTVGLFEDGQPGEIFLVMAKEGSTVSGLTDAFATAFSIALQSGVPLRTLIEKFSHVRFEPSGFTSNRRIPMAKSTIDYIARWLGSKFLSAEDQAALGIRPEPESQSSSADSAPQAAPRFAAGPDVELPFANDQDAPGCQVCGSIMVRNGSCYSCRNCGTTSGCS